MLFCIVELLSCDGNSEDVDFPGESAASMSFLASIQNNTTYLGIMVTSYLRKL